MSLIREIVSNNSNRMSNKYSSKFVVVVVVEAVVKVEEKVVVEAEVGVGSIKKEQNLLQGLGKTPIQEPEPHLPMLRSG
jgi:hypothetical protein